MSWVKYLVYIMSFLIPPVGAITFWVFGGRDGEPNEIAKWSFLSQLSLVWLPGPLLLRLVGSRITFSARAWAGGNQIVS
jgi:hypothetical protein